MNVRTTIVTAILLVGLLLHSPAHALKRRQLVDIGTNQLIEDTQMSVPCGDSHLSLVWWMPYEVWQVTFANDKSTSETDKKKILSILKPYSIIYVIV